MPCRNSAEPRYGLRATDGDLTSDEEPVFDDELDRLHRGRPILQLASENADTRRSFDPQSDSIAVYLDNLNGDIAIDNDLLPNLAT